MKYHLDYLALLWFFDLFVSGRIESDDEDEYDSELDDFIDDDEDDAANEVSKAISEIFGYDKSK